MNASNRRRLLILLVGIVVTLVALLVTSSIQADACLDAGGRWLASRRCEAPSRQLPGSGRAYLAGGVTGLLTLAFLWRALTFFGRRVTRAAA